MFKKFFSNLNLKKNWSRTENRSIFRINIVLVLLASCASVIYYFSPAPLPPQVSTQTIQNTGPTSSDRPLVEKFRGEIGKNMTLTDVLSSYDVPRELAHQLVVVTKPIYNLGKVIVGNKFELEKLPDGTLKQFLYEVDLDKYLKVYLTDGGYKAELHRFDYETQPEFVVGTIQNSLFQTIDELDEGDQLAVELAEIFSWDIDFNTELQRGDHFKLAVEKQYLDGEFVKYGKILAAEFSSNGKVYSAFYYRDPEGHSDYYSAEGKSLKRDFLKSPIKFSRISSTFSRRRFHPILKTYRPHPGVDYAAPTGTPVVAAGNGRVEFAGWKGGFGRFIQLRHGNGLTSMYGHLSRLAGGIRAGASVKQGEVIGYVGATGLATGPHLDYRVTRNGRFVNPLSLKVLPSKPVKSEYLREFQNQKGKWQAHFATLIFSRDQLASLGTDTPKSQ